MREGFRSRTSEFRLCVFRQSLAPGGIVTICQCWIHDIKVNGLLGNQANDFGRARGVIVGGRRSPFLMLTLIDGDVVVAINTELLM